MNDLIEELNLKPIISLKDKFEQDIHAFKVLDYPQWSTLLQYILNKGKAIYGDNLFDMQISELVVSHINENHEMIRKLNLITNQLEVKQLINENYLLIDYVAVAVCNAPNPEQALGRYASSVP